MFYNNATLSLSLCLFLLSKKVVPGGNWLTPFGQVCGWFDTSARHRYVRLPSSLTSLSRGTP